MITIVEYLERHTKLNSDKYYYIYYDDMKHGALIPEKAINIAKSQPFFRDLLEKGNFFFGTAEELKEKHGLKVIIR